MNNINALVEFVKANPIGVLSTMGEDGISSAAVYYMADTDGTIYFNTKRDSRKVENLLRDPEVSFVVFQREPAMTLQARGEATIVEDVSQIESTYMELLHRTFENGEVPAILKMGASQLVLVKITPTWMRLGGFSQEQAGNDPFTILVGKDGSK